MIELILGLSAMLALVVLGVPVAFALLGAAFFTFWAQTGLAFTLTQFTEVPHTIVANSAFAVIPMFVVLGQLAGELGIGTKAYDAFRKWLTFARSGVLAATVAGSALFGAISGSTVAAASLFTKVTLPELKRFRYSEALSLGTIAAAGTLAAMIPPSVTMVIFSMFTGVSLGKLLIAGIVPGFMLAALLIAMLEVIARVKPHLIPPMEMRTTWKEKSKAAYGIWPVFLVFVVLIGGIYAGFFTPNAAGAIGAAIMLLWAVARKAKFSSIVGCFGDTAMVVAQIFLIIIGGLIFSKVAVLSNVIPSIVGLFSGLPTPVVFAFVVLLYFVLGSLLDPTSMMAITLPFTFPLLTSLGFDGVQVGVIMVLLVEIAVITPPVGFNCFVVAGAANVHAWVVFRGIVPMLAMLIFGVALLGLFPQISLWLPQHIMGG